MRLPAAARLRTALLLSGLPLAACATGPRPGAPIAVAVAPSPPSLRPRLPADDPGATLGLYLAAEAALDGGDGAQAAELFGRAAAADPGDASLRQRAFSANLIAGDVPAAARLAPEGAGAAPDAAALGHLVRAVDALADGRGADASALLADASAARAYGTAVALLTPWAAAETGARTPAPVSPPPLADRTAGRFAALGRARLLERAGDLKGAEAVFKPLTADHQALFTDAYGGFLERRGRRTEAVALYDAALKTDGDSGPDAALAAARARAAGDGPAPRQPTVREGAAEALLGPASALLVARRADLGLIYVRLALRLDPSLDQAWLVLGDTLAGAGDPDGARDAYRRVREDRPEGAAAAERLALAAEAAGDKVEALRLARRGHALAPTDPQAGVVLAEVLRSQEKLDEAVAVLDPLIAAQERDGPGGPVLERLLFLRGSALERAGRWPQAEADLQHALKLKPDDAEVQNYLGFAWADRGEHLKEALAMLEHAAAVQPDQGAVLDSVGWARFRMGDLRGALRDLEKAVALEPADAEINDHLGDVYQRAGRGAEALYQWRRVLTLEPEAKTRAAAEAKLRSVGATPPSASVAVPGAPAA